jgi:hypothetical protein
MKDLDFDELDRAVSTLMNDVPKSELAKDDENSTNTLSISPTLGQNEVPKQNTIEQTTLAPSPRVAPQSRPATTPPAARRGGRFMDVVHHSSNMKKDKPATSQPISRQGLTIEPVKSTPPSPVNPVLTPESTPVVTPAPAEKSIPQTIPESPVQSSDWPDPLDLSESQSPTADYPEATVDLPGSTPLLEEGSRAEVTAPTSDELEPLTSPFLSGTKVEKRPLGSSQPAGSDEAPEPDHTPVISTTEGEMTVNDPSDQLPASPSDEVKKELPPELQGDLVAIESGSASENTKSQEPTREEESKELQSSYTPHPAALLEATTDDEPAFTGPTSIAQQYKEEPNTGDQKNGAIYDTDTYHKPLAHPAQKKSGWLWVVWIVLILFIGAGAGAALYFLRVI